MARIKAPPPFTAVMSGPEGVYHLAFSRYDDRDGYIDTTIRGIDMSWNVDSVERADDGSIILGGLTRGSEALWLDCFWFALCLNPKPFKIDYWGNQVLWRTDLPLETP